MGDLVFAIVIMMLALWTLRRLELSWFHRDDRFVLTRALAATLAVLIGIPIAVVNQLAGALHYRWRVPRRLVVAIVRKLREESVLPLWPAASAAVGLPLAALPSRSRSRLRTSCPRPRRAGGGGRGLDAELAMTFRPLLFFDSGETRYPLDIDKAIEDGRVDQCRKYLVVDRCPDVNSAEEIDMTFDYLDFDESAPPPRGGGDESAYYYHVTRDGDRRFLDYWWFYSRNPSPVADKVFCGPGFRTPPFTCQEHAGDWEGMTVVVAPCEEESETCVDVGGELLGPTSVRYAQHAHLLSYSWAKTLEPGAGSCRRRRLGHSRWSGTGSFCRPSRTTVFAPSRSSPATAMPRTPTRASATAGRRWGRCPRPATTEGSRGRTTSPATAASSPCRSTRTETTRPGTLSPGAGAPRSASLPGVLRPVAGPEGPVLPGPLRRADRRRRVDLHPRHRFRRLVQARDLQSALGAARQASAAGSPHVCQCSISMNAVTPR